MFTIRMAEISDHAGNAGDGIVRGFIYDDTPSTMVSTSIEGPEPIGAFNLDLAGGNIDFTDYHVEAVSGVSNSFLPWGTNATFSIGDCLYVSSSEPITQARFTIDTGAVWVSSSSGDQFEIRDSTDGVHPNRVLTITGDTSNGFRNTGTVTIDFVPSDALPRQSWTPVPGLIAAAEWICIAPKGYVSSTVSPKMSMTYLLGNGMDHNDITTIYNAPMADGTFAVAPNVVYFPDAETIFSLTAPAPILDIEVHQKSANYYNHIWEYYSTSGVWTAFINVNDPSNGLKNGPATLTVNPPELFHVRWQLPSDWDSVSLTIPGLGVVIGAHVRLRITTVLNVGPTPPPYARARGRTLDNAGGVIHLAQATYSALTFEASVPPASNTAAQLFNMNSRASAVVSFPAHVKSSCNILPLQRLVLSSPVTVNPGESLFITWQGGDVLQDVELVLE